MTQSHTQPPSVIFTRAVAQVEAVSFREDFVVRSIDPPGGLAPEALALAGDVRPEPGAEDSAFGTGRLILLHDSSEPDAWGGSMRLVCFAQAPLEPDIGVDALLADVAWSWLVDALASRNAGYHSPAGTTTRTLSKGFGSLTDEGEGAQIELRASWSPSGDIGPHIHAWEELVCMLAGLPPGSESIAVFGARRARA